MTGNTITGFSQAGIRVFDQAGTYQGNRLGGNVYGLMYSGSAILDATLNDWGDPTGPLDDSDDRANGGYYNPGGRGSRVSDRVMYYPWSGSQAPRLINISTCARVGAGDDVMIGGFVISGTAPHKVLIRAIGPSMTSAGVTDTLANPRIRLTKVTGEFVASNDNWQDGPNATEIATLGRQPADPNESALLITLNPNTPYTPIVDGVDGTTGVALVEVYDMDEANAGSRLINISTRGKVGTGDNVIIGGFVINGFAPKQVLIRAIGPSMAAAGVTGTLTNPRITLTTVTGQPVASNDNWQDDPNAAAIQAMGRQPEDPNESALLVTLNPNTPYTPIIDGVGGDTGVALVEVYEIP